MAEPSLSACTSAGVKFWGLRASDGDLEVSQHARSIAEQVLAVSVMHVVDTKAAAVEEARRERPGRHAVAPAATASNEHAGTNVVLWSALATAVVIGSAALRLRRRESAENARHR